MPGSPLAARALPSRWSSPTPEPVARFQALNDFLNAWRGGRTFVLALGALAVVSVALLQGKVTGLEYAGVLGAITALVGGSKYASGKRAELEGGGAAEVTRAVTGQPEPPDEVECDCFDRGGRCDGSCSN